MPAAPSPIVATSIASPAAVARTPPIIHQQPKVHIQAGQQQQSIVLPIRTTPMTTQVGIYLELVSKELNHLAAFLHVYAGGLNFMKYKKKILLLFYRKKMEILLHFLSFL